VLQRLFIQNYAIIEEIEISFDGRMNVITGETGAGKSIIAGALGLILGDRADLGVMLNKDKKCIVEGLFRSDGRLVVQDFLDSNELDVTAEIVIRREITPAGKSRAFINDTPVNLSQLQTLGSLLVDLHRQFDNLDLSTIDFQVRVIDALSGQTDKTEQYRSVFEQLKETVRRAGSMKEKKQQFEKEADYHQFQFNELEEAGLLENELEEIDAELKLLNSAEEIRAVLQKASYTLDESEEPLVQQLKILVNSLMSYASFHPDLGSLLQRLQSAQIELQDIAQELQLVGQQVQYDPGRISHLNDRLSLGYKLLKKHGARTTNDLLAIQQDLQSKLQAVFDLGEELAAVQKEIVELTETAKELGSSISANRMKQVKPFETKVNKLLSQVGMPNARLNVLIQSAGELNEYGADIISFVFDANKSGQFQPIGKVASGGELSRLMLCIKSLVADSIDLPTLIFDEVDTGISGEAARQVGVIMKGLSSKRQVVTITHQPQIAGKANAHYFVYKEIVNNNIRTSIRLLGDEERIVAIAKMLSGEKPTAAAMENAREMLN
jgi:DNA repair protein RecN (Recombination protein N)